MGQILRGSATTTHAVRAAIQRSKAPLKELAAQYGLNHKTVAKRRKRAFVHDAAMGPKAPHSTVLSSRAQKIEVTRSRAYKKNDQAFVEQKNGAIVRRLVGYGRFEGIETARILVRLYAASRLHTNYFQPSF